MALASRDQAVFDQNVLDWGQMDAMAAIVDVNGREHFFDPGTRLCPFDHMAPAHSNAIGVSAEAKLVKIRMTPQETYQSDRTEQVADLILSPDGKVSGSVKIAWYGTAGLPMRLEALRTDPQEVQTTVEEQLQGQVPDGVEVKLDTLSGLADGEAPLAASFRVSGSLGVAAGKRLILPAHFFASTAKPALTPETRTQPILFPKAYVDRDQVLLHLLPGLAVEALPEPHTLTLGSDTAYNVVVQAALPGQNLIVAQRAFVLGRIDYKPEEYPTLHKYFGQLAGFDGEQVVLTRGSATPSGSNKSANP